LLHHPIIRLAEREESLALSRSRRLGIPSAPEHYLVQNPIGDKNRMRRLHCRYCVKKSAYSCACAPWTGGGMKVRDAMVVCSDRQGGRCMLRHGAREKPPQKRVRSKRHSWTSKPKASPKNAEPDNAEDRSIPFVVQQRMSRCSNTVPPKQPINSNLKLIADHILQEYHL